MTGFFKIINQNWSTQKSRVSMNFEIYLVICINALHTRISYVHHCGMKDESWHFLSTFLENLAIKVLFNAEFNGIIRISIFRHAITSKFKKKLKNLVRLHESCHNVIYMAFFWNFSSIQKCNTVHADRAAPTLLCWAVAIVLHARMPKRRPSKHAKLKDCPSWLRIGGKNEIYLSKQVQKLKLYFL